MSIGSLWLLDANYNVYYYDGRRWERSDGELKSLSAGESIILGIQPRTNYIYYRKGADIDTPKGERWGLLSVNNQNIQSLESGYSGYIFGIDKQGVLYYCNLNDAFRLDSSWKRVPLKLKDNGIITDAISSISCGSYSCWIQTNTGNIYAANTPYKDIDEITWTADDGE